MADAAVQLPYLATHYEIPESTLSSLTEAPTIDLVNQLLQSITKKAHEHDELKSDKLRLDVELENAVRSNESKVKVLKNTIEKGHVEVQDLRTKLHESGKFFTISRSHLASTSNALQITRALLWSPRSPRSSPLPPQLNPRPPH